MGCENSTSSEKGFFGGTKLFNRRGYNTEGGVSKEEGQKYFQEFLLGNGKKFDKDLPSWWVSWGKNPLDHIVVSDDYILKLIQSEGLNQNSVKIVEPWSHIGKNQDNDKIRASINVAYIVQIISDMDSVLFPLWKHGNQMKIDNLLPAILNGYATVFEGGLGDVAVPDSFNQQVYDQTYLTTLYMKVLTNSKMAQRCIFLGMSHQVLAYAIIDLIRYIVDQCHDENNYDNFPYLKKKEFQAAIKYIDTLGRNVKVSKKGMEPVKGYLEYEFPSFKNNLKQAQKQKLVPFEIPIPKESNGLTEEIIEGYRDVAEKNSGVMEAMIEKYESLKLHTFGISEINQEAMVFAGWAFGHIHKTIKKLNLFDEIKQTPLNWLIDIPFSLEVIGSTRDENNNILTEVANMRIDFVPYDGSSQKTYYSQQYHIEVMDQCWDFNNGKVPTYEQLKKSQGVQLLIRELCSKD